MPKSDNSTAPPIPEWVPEQARPALERLLAGNQRFVTGQTIASKAWRPGLELGQAPFAVVLCCADSRTPAEVVFDQGLGDLFVVRVAGNVVAPSLAGSVEFAVQAFGIGLVLVLGHTYCGAVRATLGRLLGGTTLGGNVSDIVDRISPSLRTALDARTATAEDADNPELIHLAVRANVRSSVSHLVHASRHLEQTVQAKKLTVLGAVLNLEHGTVSLVE